MAKNKIKAELEIDDKGNMKKIADGSRKAGKGLKDTAESAQTADRRLKGASQQSANGTKNFSKMAQGIQSGLVPAYALLASNVFAITAAFNALKSAADFRVIKDAQIAFSSATGIGMMSLTNTIKEATDGLVGFRDASSAAAIGTASGLSLEQIQKFAKGARDVSLILGRDVTDSFNRLIRGVTKAEPELLDELGIILRLTTATEKYAAMNNKAVSSLTLLEKSQAVAVEVLDQLDTKYAAVAQAVELNSNEVAKLGIAFEKIIHPFQQFVSFAAEPTAKFLAENIKALTAAFALLIIPIVKSLIPGLEQWGATSAEKAKQAKKAYMDAREEIERLKQAQVDLKVSQSSPGAAAQVALEGVKSKSTGIQKIQAGDFSKMSKREINGLLRAAEKGKGAVTQMSARMKRQYIAALRSMKNETKTSFTQMRVQIRGFVDKSIIQFKKMKAQYQATITFMKRGTALFSKFANKVMKLAGFVGIFLLVKDIVVEIAKKFGFLEQSDEVKQLAEEFDKLTDKLKTAEKEFSKFAAIQEKYRAANKGIIGATEDQVIAIGNLIETQFGIFKGGFDVFDKYNKLIGRTNKESERMVEIQKRLRFLQGKGRMVGGRVPEDTGIAPVTRRLQGPIDESEATAVLELKRELRELQNIEETRRQEYNKSFIEKHLLDQVNIVEKYDEAMEQLKTNSGQMAAGLRLAGIESQAGGKRFLELLDAISEGKDLLPEQRKEFQELGKQFTTLGREASAAKQAMVQLNQQFDKTMISITGFQTKFTDQISQTTELIEKYTTGTLKNTDEAKENIKILGDQLVVLKALQAIEIGFQNQTATLNAAKARAAIGLTKSQATELERAAKILDIEIKRGKMLAELGEAVAEYARSGKQVDQDKITLYTQQVALLDAQNEELERQTNNYAMLKDSMMQALEGATQTSLANLIKGDEASLSRAIQTIAKTTLTAAADQLAKQMTAGLFRTDTPENRIKTAMMEGGHYAATQIAAAMAGDYRPTVVRDKDGNIESITPLNSLETGLTKLEGSGKSTIQETFTDFTTSISELFSGEGGFLKGLKGIFSTGIDAFAGVFSGLFGGGEGGGLFSAITSLFGFGSGGVMTSKGKMSGYSTGGIARGSQRGYPAILHGTEAVVPLPNGKSIPVEMNKGSQQTQNNIVVNVTTDGRVSTQGSTGPDMDKMGGAIAKAVQIELQNQKRSGGILSPYGPA